MNTLFFDVYNEVNEENNKCKNNTISSMINSILGYRLNIDILNDGIIKNNFYLNIGKSSINKNNSIISRVSKYMIAKSLYKNINKCYKVNIVTSNRVDINDIEYLNEILNLVVKFDKGLNGIKDKFNFIHKTNNMIENDIKYIEEFVEYKKIDKAKLRLLVIISEINELNIEQIEKYIQIYKFVDILKVGTISSYNLTMINNSIRKINDEFGTTIEFIQNRNLAEYNVYLNYTELSKSSLMSEYVLSANPLVINIMDADEDYKGINIKTYNLHTNELKTLFSRLGIDINNYSKNKLGALMLEEYNILDK